MRKKVVIFEVEGGADKNFTGHRADTMPIVYALEAAGWGAEVIFYRAEWAEQIIDYVVGRFDGYISRVNPGTVPGGEAGYFTMLRTLTDNGLVGLQHPDEMIKFGSKDVLVHLANTELVPNDTYAYYTVPEMQQQLPVALSHGERVLKQNRGSTGSGIWRVRILDEQVRASIMPGEAVPLDTMLHCTEAFDNHVEHHTLADFMHMCEQYILGDNGMLVDMRFMPRVKEGEIRVLMVGQEPVCVVHKKPLEDADAFSATLFSGAKYQYQTPDAWHELLGMFLPELENLRQQLDAPYVPLVWTADFIMDTAPDGSDRYVISEINCSCVGFTSQLDMGIQERIAAEAIKQITARLG